MSEFCDCSACKNKNPTTGGKYMHSSSVWRHKKKEHDLDIDLDNSAASSSNYINLQCEKR